MFTQCPECHHPQTLTIDQLRETRGIIRCSHCSTQFDALQRLGETPADVPLPPSEEQLPWVQDRKPANPLLWNSSAAAGLILLCGQIIYFQGPSALQHEKFRPWFIEACSYLGCSLPDYRNLTDFSVLTSSLILTADQNYYFKATINNQAEFAQPYPGIKLTLLKLSGEPFAQRAFTPDNLTFRTDKIAPHETIEIGLAIAAPSASVGGYTFELI